MSKIFYDDGKGLLKILDDMVSGFEINNDFPSLRRSIGQFEFDDVYTDILDYHEHIICNRDDYDSYILQQTISGNEIIDRYKAEDSLKYKWDKASNKDRRLFEVCNDAWAIRIITNISVDELKLEVEKISEIAKIDNYKIETVNFYDRPKKDGYRGIHLYFKNNKKCYPVEIQFWTRKDWFLQRYTHEVIYKQSFDEDASDYSNNLRKWVDNIPVSPKEVDSFIDYYYEVINSINYE